MAVILAEQLRVYCSFSDMDVLVYPRLSLLDRLGIGELRNVECGNMECNLYRSRYCLSSPVRNKKGFFDGRSFRIVSCGLVPVDG